MKNRVRQVDMTEQVARKQPLKRKVMDCKNRSDICARNLKIGGSQPGLPIMGVKHIKPFAATRTDRHLCGEFRETGKRKAVTGAFCPVGVQIRVAGIAK
jgi:hypothetical protein